MFPVARYRDIEMPCLFLLKDSFPGALNVSVRRCTIHKPFAALQPRLKRWDAIEHAVAEFDPRDLAGTREPFKRLTCPP